MPTPTPSSAVDQLLQQAHEDVRERRTHDALGRLERCAVEMDLEELEAKDERRGKHGALYGHVLRLTNALPRAREVLESVLLQAREYGWHAAGARAAIQLGWLVRSAGDTTSAERLLREALRFASSAGTDEQVLSGTALAEILSLNGDRSGAESMLESVAERASSPEMRFRVEYARAQISDRHGRPEEAERSLRLAAKLAPNATASYEVCVQHAKHALARNDEIVALKAARRAAKLASDWSSPVVQAGARMLLGEVARTFGRHDEADRAYRSAQQLYGESVSSKIARLNRAQNEISRGRYDLGAALARPLADAFPANPIASSVVELCQLPRLIAEKIRAVERLRVSSHADAEVSAIVDGVLVRLSASGIVHRDIASLAREVAQVLSEAGWLELAVRLEALGHDQWRRIGNSAEMVRTATRLRELRAEGAPIPLRQFILDGVLGEGASGTVWQGRHAASGEIVAIKVLRGGASVTANVRSMFARELRAVAGLDHPNVVWLVDHGWIDEAASIVDSRLEIDAPFLVLEYAPQGTLDLHCGRLPWASVLEVSRAVLDALAHAHARGLLHLDLKPTNVLLAGTPSRWIPKLADFGLARAPAPGRQLRATGTPAYMAPEQFGQDAGALGPWTDLYAFGCVMTSMITGAPPFGLGGTAMLRDAHLSRKVPEFKLTTPVPSGLIALVMRLLAKAPSQRFRSAAEVSDALSSLGPPDLDTGPVVFEARLDSVPTLVLTTLEPSGAPAADHPPRSRPARPFPPRWRGEVLPEPRPRSLVAAGLGIVSLRRPRTIGRERERDVLWGTLASVVEGNQGAAISIHGPQGAGARQLVRWLAERAHELGAARGLMVSPEQPLPAALLTDDDDALRRELERLSQARPLVIGLLRAEGIRGAERLQRAVSQVQGPVLVAASSLSPAGSPPAFTSLTLGPMSQRTLLEIITMLLPLSPALAEPICARSFGNPGAMVRMVRQLAIDRQLVPCADGWQLRPSADLDVVLSAAPHTAEHLRALHQEDRVVLEVLAVLGGQSDVAAWENACRAMGVADPGASLGRLSREGWLDVEGAVLMLGEGVSQVLAIGLVR